MNERLKNFKSYLKSELTRLSTLNSKVNGENNEEYSEREKQLLRSYHSEHLKREKLELEN